VFRLFEIRQDGREGPTGIPELFPLVEVARGAADVNHGVDGAGAAKNFAARPVKAAVVELGLGFGGIIPVDGGFKEFGEGGGDGDFAGARRAPSFQEQDARVRVFREAGGENATGRAGADDDVLVFGVDVGGRGHGLGGDRIGKPHP